MSSKNIDQNNFNLNKCKKCENFKCIIAKSLFQTNIKIKKHQKKIKKLLNDLKHYNNIFDTFAYSKYTLSKNQLNILNISLNEQKRITELIRKLNKEFYS